MKKPVTIRHQPVLRFTPTAWSKLLFLRDLGETEIGGFGIAGESDLLLVQQLVLVRQTASLVHVEFDDQAVADFFDAQVDAGRQPQEFARIWIHTHPGNSAQPSQTDEKTFARVFGGADWAVMFILARGGQVFARLRYNVGPGVDVAVPIEVDYGPPFDGSDQKAWEAEYVAQVRVPDPEPELAAELDSIVDGIAGRPSGQWYEDWYEYAETDGDGKEAIYGYPRDF